MRMRAARIARKPWGRSRATERKAILAGERICALRASKRYASIRSDMPGTEAILVRRSHIRVRGQAPSGLKARAVSTLIIPIKGLKL